MSSVKLKTPSENRPPRNLSNKKDSVQDLVQTISYKKECPTITNLPDGTETYNYKEKNRKVNN